MDLAREDRQEDMRGKLKTAMYGARDAAQNVELEHTEMMVEVGFTQGSDSACMFYRKEKDIRLLYMEVISQYLDRELDLIGSVKSLNVAWR